MQRRTFAAVCFCLTALKPIGAVTRTVCLSGCDYTSLQAAYTASLSDCTIDRITVRHGETFTANGSIQFNYRPCEGALVIESDASAELPPIGTRVTTAQAPLMPRLTSSNASTPVLRFGNLEMLITAADTTAHTITLNSEPASISQLTVGTAISCTDRTNGRGFAGSGLPQPLARSTKYFITSMSGITSNQATVQLASTPGGPPLPISTTEGINFPSSNYYAQPQCALWNNAHDITFRGLDITVPDPGPGNNYQNVAVQVGVAENDVRALVRNITFEQCLIHLDPSFTDRGLQTGLEMEASGVTFADGYIEAIGFAGTESHGVATQICQHCAILNNQMDSVGAAVFTGGAAGPVPQLTVNDLKIQGNFMVVPGWMYVMDSNQIGSTTPPSPCYFEQGSGAQFIDRTGSPSNCIGGACRTCQPNGTWAVDGGATFHAAISLPKTRMEFKEGHNIDISGNIIRGNVVGGDTGNTGCVAFVLVEQSLIDSSGTFYYDHQGINVHDNWCDRVWSGFLIGQTAPTVGPGPTNITGISAANGRFAFTVGSNAGFTNYTYAFFSGINASGTMGTLNGRWNYECGGVGSCANSFPDGTTIITDPTTTPDRFTAVTGSYGSGGQIQAVRWRPSVMTNVWNNVLTRTGQYPQLSMYTTFNGALARPFRFFDGIQGGPIYRKNTIRQDDSYPGNNWAAAFESGLGHGQYNQAQIRDSIFANYYYGFFESVAENCNNAGYGGWFGSTSAFSNNLSAGPLLSGGPAWPSGISACSANLASVFSDAAVGYAGSDQSVLANSRLAASSAYSASNSSATLLSSDGTDLGADVEEASLATSGALAGTPPWDVLSGLQWELGSTKLIAHLQGTAPWILRLYSAPARIAGNQIASVADSCAVCVVDGAHRQIVITGLSAGGRYYYSATDGTRTLVGQVTTLPAGSGVYNFHVSGLGARYSPNRDMGNASPAAGGVVPVASDAVVYTDHGVGTPVRAMVAR